MSTVVTDPEILTTEREEVEWLLTSGVMGRSANLARVLRYVCEESFAGRGEQIKEYGIAVEALGRRPDFDPQTNTIVRVTVHALRKRLEEVYRGEGQDRPLRVLLPPGRYAPSFLPNRGQQQAADLEAETASSEDPVLEASIPAEKEIELAQAAAVSRPPSRRASLPAWLAVAAVVGLLICGTIVWMMRHRGSIANDAHDENAPALQPEPADTVHALLGPGAAQYTDHSGQVWRRGSYCQGGTTVSVPNQKIAGTEDSALYLSGIRGIAHCIFPVKHGLYELHFHFAETSDLEAARRPAILSINAGPNMSADVVGNAGGNGAATTTVVTGIAPENDGAIHLDYTSEVSPLNAVEILPAPSADLLPVRIVAASAPWLDNNHQLWLSDRYFSGGRHGQSPESSRLAGLGIYSSNRVGRFRYDIPAVPRARYRLRLYFREPWFGQVNGANGGPGSRIFDVECNGAILLKDFDILAEGHSAPMVKTFDHIQATPSGRIELYFMPVVNYAIVSAIEIVPEESAPQSQAQPDGVHSAPSALPITPHHH